MICLKKKNLLENIKEHSRSGIKGCLDCPNNTSVSNKQNIFLEAVRNCGQRAIFWLVLIL